ncbi:protein of unknown function [Candidatus Hydrogenisulfobacillus filiaventi]|uniref:EAL domain-containing protein n=1 Tax=Candidatus Hydrogenisulfobacillus filiaventi TaxID=2707344 RepID=A0A6F8ZL69_9FIRM|nr:protein of unknown function [Candidatus Hydrogenisulfobacillus filiaventi]
MVFQPLVALPDGRVVGYEALVRPQAGGRPLPPAVWFHRATAAGMATAADLRCLEALCRTLDAGPAWDGGWLFANVQALTLREAPDQAVALAACLQARTGGRLVLEVGEHMPEPLPTEFWAGLPGVIWALDDFGNGDSDLLRWLALRPAWVKVDRLVLWRALEDAFGQDGLRHLAAWADAHGVRLVAEGVESAEMAALVARLGIGYGQGFWWGRPQAGWQGRG